MKPAKAAAPRIRPKQSCIVAFCEICRSATDQILKNRAVIHQSDDPEGPHQMRIGLRRLRSALKAFRPAIDDRVIRDLSGASRNLGLVLSELRDADVLATEIVRSVVARHPDNPDLPLLMTALAAVRSERRKKVLTALQSDQWVCLHRMLKELPRHLDCVSRSGRNSDLNQPILAASHKVLRRLWRRVERWGERIDELTLAERHEMRKDLKTLRYAIDFLAPLYSAKRVNAFLNKLGRLQDKFGYLIDVAVAQKLPIIVPQQPAKNPALQRAIGFVNGWHAGRAESGWEDTRIAWKGLAKSRPFWRE
jgi:CHAD domain-containing protein